MAYTITITLLLLWSFYLTLDKFLFKGSLLTCAWAKCKSHFTKCEKTETIPQEPIPSELLIERRSYEPGHERSQADTENQTGENDTKLASPSSEKQDAEQTETATDPSGRIAADQLDRVFENTSPPDDYDDYDRMDEDGEAVDIAMNLDADMTQSGVDINDLGTLFGVCANGSGTDREISVARKAFRDIEGTLFEEMILSQINGADTAIGVLFDIYLKPVQFAEPKNQAKISSVDDFNVDDFV